MIEGGRGPNRRRGEDADEPPEGDRIVPPDPRTGRDLRDERRQGGRLLRLARL